MRHISQKGDFIYMRCWNNNDLKTRTTPAIGYTLKHYLKRCFILFASAIVFILILLLGSRTVIYHVWTPFYWWCSVHVLLLRGFIALYGVLFSYGGEHSSEGRERRLVEEIPNSRTVIFLHQVTNCLYSLVCCSCCCAVVVCSVVVLLVVCSVCAVVFWLSVSLLYVL